MKHFKNILLTITLLILVAPEVDAQFWNLVWADEFNGTSIDATNWTMEIGTGSSGWGNNEWQFYTGRPENASIQNGNLAIVAKKELYAGSNYTSARMITQGKQSWKYGKIEARIKFPLRQGIWPAFWMLGSNFSSVGWPKCGEIDIMEHINTSDDIHGTIHWDANGYATYGGNQTIFNVGDFHTYAIEWDAASIKWFVDGNQYHSANILNGINSTQEFHEPFFLILNMAVGGNWPGYPNVNDQINDTMLVDYVRVYENGLAPTAVGEISKEDKIICYPNPLTELNNFYLKFPKAGMFYIELVNSVGQIIYEDRFSVSSQRESVKILPETLIDNGMYFFRIKGSEHSQIIKVLVEK